MLDLFTIKSDSGRSWWPNVVFKSPVWGFMGWPYARNLEVLASICSNYIRLYVLFPKGFAAQVLQEVVVGGF